MRNKKLPAQCLTLCGGSRNVPQLLFPVACSPPEGISGASPGFLCREGLQGKSLQDPLPNNIHCAKHLPKAWRSNGSVCIQIVGTMLCSGGAIAYFPRMHCETCVSALQHPPTMFTVPTHRFLGLLTGTLSQCLKIPPACFLLVMGIRGLCGLGGRCSINATILWVEGSMI